MSCPQLSHYLVGKSVAKTSGWGCLLRLRKWAVLHLQSRSHILNLQIHTRKKKNVFCDACSKKQKVRLTPDLARDSPCRTAFLAKEYCLAQNLETALSPYDIFDRVTGGLICCCCCCFFFNWSLFLLLIHIADIYNINNNNNNNCNCNIYVMNLQHENEPCA